MRNINSVQSDYISAVFDNEASEMEVRRLLKTLNSEKADYDPEQAEAVLTQWLEYQTISDRLQRRDTHSDLQFLRRLNQRIDEEAQPTSWTQRMTQRYGRVVSQTALAASVSFFAILGVQQYQLAQVESNAPEQSIASHEAYTPTQFPQQFPVPVVRTQPVSASSSYTQPIQTQIAPAQTNKSDASASEATASP